MQSIEGRNAMIANAFTCTGSYAILILYGIKRTENRSAWPEPREGRASRRARVLQSLAVVAQIAHLWSICGILVFAIDA